MTHLRNTGIRIDLQEQRRGCILRFADGQNTASEYLPYNDEGLKRITSLLMGLRRASDHVNECLLDDDKRALEEL